MMGTKRIFAIIVSRKTGVFIISKNATTANS